MFLSQNADVRAPMDSALTYYHHNTHPVNYAPLDLLHQNRQDTNVFVIQPRALAATAIQAQIALVCGRAAQHKKLTNMCAKAVVSG